MPKLTKTIVDNTMPGEKDVFVWCSELEGFGIRVQPSGRKTYMVRYRVQDANRTQRKQNIARCSDMPPDKARDLARKVFGQVAEGLDPLKARRTDKDSPTMLDLKERYINEHAKPFKKDRSRELDEKNWRLYIIPAIGKKFVRDITKADILSIHGSLSLKTATANQTLALLSKAFNLAEDWEWRDRHTNPCHRVKKYDIEERELILTEAQIGDLNTAMNDMVAERQITQPMADLVRLLMLTGCRLREIMHARRDWIDRARNLLLIPIPNSKVGQRRIPLSPTTLALIDAMPADEEWLIPGQIKGQPLITPYKPWKMIKARAGVPMELRMHDLRHTTGSLGHLSGMSQKEIQLMLGHKNMATTERYLHGAVGGEAVIANRMSDLIVGAWANQPAVNQLPA